MKQSKAALTKSF